LVYLKEILVYLVILKDIPLVIFMELNSQNLYSKWASQTAKKDMIVIIYHMPIL